jgi:hypothetical protein
VFAGVAGFGESAGLLTTTAVLLPVVAPPPQLVKKKTPQTIAVSTKSLIFRLFILFLTKIFD